MTVQPEGLEPQGRAAEMSCQWILDRIALLPSGDLPRDERVLCRAHLRDCHSCRREFGTWFGLRKELQSLRPTVDAVPSEAADAHFFTDLKRDVLDRIAQDCASTEPPRVARWRWVAGAAAAGVLFAIGLHFGRSTDALDGDLLRSGPLQNPSHRTEFHTPSLLEPVGQPATAFGPWEGLSPTSKIWIQGSESVLGEAARKALAEELIGRDQFGAADAEAIKEAERRVERQAKQKAR